MRATAIARAGLLAFALAGCGSGGLATHRDLGGGPTALLTATIVDENGCVLATGENGARWLVIWPSGFRRQGDVILDGLGRPVTAIGQEAALGGGEYHDDELDFLKTLFAEPPPAHCSSEEYWLVTEVVD